MGNRKSLAAAVAVSIGLWAPLAAVPASAAETDTAARLRAAISGEHREANNRARDVYRHPFETLSFFGIEPDMTVVEIWPGGGWYSEILAPFLKDRGRLYAASWDKDLKSDSTYYSIPMRHYGEIMSEVTRMGGFILRRAVQRPVWRRKGRCIPAEQPT